MSERVAAAVFQTLVTVKTVTSANGDPGGAWIICASLIGYSDVFTGKQIVIPSGPDKGDLTDITAFNPATGRIDVSPSFKMQIGMLNEVEILNQSAMASVAQQSQTAANEAGVVDDHFHNYEQEFGKAAAPTATHFADPDSLTTFQAISGNGAFGAACNVLGSADTPFRAGMLYFDPREWSIVDVSDAHPYIVKLIWGTAAQTEAQAEAAMQYSTFVVHQPTANGQNKPQEGRILRRIPGNQIWIKVKNQTNLATMDFLLTIHEYPSPSP